jgi:hypothetical protein
MRRLRDRAQVKASYWIGCAAVLLFAQAAGAQTSKLSGSGTVEDAATSRARALFNEGTDEARHGDWSQALMAFERSAALHPHPVTSYNIGYCERALGRSMRARKMLGEALADNAASDGVELPGELATAAKAYLDELKGRVVHTFVTISTEGASVAVDGRPLERTATTDGPRPVLWAGTRELGPGEPAPASPFALELDPGVHVFVVSKAGYVDEVTIRTLEPGDEATVVLQLSPRARAAAALGSARTPAMTDTPSTRPAGGHSAFPWVIVGIGGALMVTGAALYGAGASDLTSAQSECPAHEGCTQGSATLGDHGRTLKAWGALGLGSGVVLAAGGLVWHLLEKTGDSKRATGTAMQTALVSSRVGSTGGALAGVELAPWVTPNGAGVLGTF